MDILYIAIPLALAVAAFFVIAFLWSVRTGQMDDLETPAIRMLFEDNRQVPSDPPQTAPEASKATPTEENSPAWQPADPRIWSKSAKKEPS